MEIFIENDKEYILVANKNHLNELFEEITNLKPFADKFKFTDINLFIKLIELLEIDYDEFTQKYFYYDSLKKLHISQSMNDYIWISTVGLVANGKSTTNSMVNSCLSQYLVLSLLFEEAIELTNDESVYNIDSYNSGRLTELTPAIYHNLIFYIEVFCKAYLSLTKTEFPFTHSLPLLYKQTVETMNNNSHNDSLFQILILDKIYNFVNHIENMPKGFKEHNIKYNDNYLDDTIFLCDNNGLIELYYILEYTNDFISEYYYMGNKNYYLKTDIYQRMLKKADTEDKKNRIKEMYPHLGSKK
ncbi:hypothetical protein HX004_17055 [Myroides sp. 1354]|uniref:hypothetical protein n=1 Tax=unclassified Myroides TaxID=2642485 RepID=UPI0025777DC7|nr:MULTISPECIES: hypothetical protein [unclassified Myroides]MDM1046533.1 hypothetical protein [Myroides sp. R163-1]MDM1057466.1 hypothetical protein [Myroides sp. 1354]MDM1070751.1 hypothetical protein [Myroides sp. 1372]